MRYIVITIFTMILLSSCAKRGSITGGLQDTLPPVVKENFPKNGAVNFKGDEIRITFDEYVKLKDVNKQLVISPPMTNAPLILPSTATKQIKIKIKDELLPNTTYSFNFGQSIQDNNEGNALNQYKYIFSTGTYIDSLFLEGTIKDAYELKTDDFVSVLLYEANDTFNDSTIYLQKPRYVTNTLDIGTTFRLENLKAGEYYLVAIKDMNSNLKFDPKSEKIAFYPNKITLPDPAIYELELFKEIREISTKKPSQASGNRYILPVEGDKTKIKVALSNFENPVDVYVTNFPDKDSVQVWFPKQKADSLQFTVSSSNHKKDYVVTHKNQKVDTLNFSAVKTGTLHFRETFGIKSSTPQKSFDVSKMKMINQDSLDIKFEPRYDDFNQTLWIDFEKDENQKYVFSILPNGIEDVFEAKNDSLAYKFNTRNYTDYGNLRLNLQNVKSFPVLIELTDEKGKILASEYTTSENFVDFKNLQPNLFYIRIIYDTNQNKKWDAGSYFKREQSEESFYYPTPIDVRANWDVEQSINLKP
jgi:uncharacterized protein (DUF2141 family)